MEKISVFISKPNALTSGQDSAWQALKRLLEERDLMPRSIGAIDYPNDAPLTAVVRVMQNCKGAMILGFGQTLLRDGVLKPGTEDETSIQGLLLPTPWNQIEGGIAFELGLPLFVAREKGVEGGVFDYGVLGNYLHTFDLSGDEWLADERFLQPFNSWYAEVIRHADGTAEK